jgi:lipoprotein-releasing system ATP-binding protein
MAARLPDDNGVQTMLRVVGLAKIYPAVSGRAGAGGGDSAANSREAVGERQGAGERQENGARGEVVLFRGLEFSIAASEMVAIVGESGTGKSSLLHLLAALDRPTAGEVWVRSAQDREINLGELNAREAAEFRNREVGYVWQFHYLLPEFTALENVAMPLLARGVRRAEALEKASVWLDEVGLAARGEHRSGELSGGEQQRVSLARALVTGPKLLLADLDGKTAEAVFSLIQRLHYEHRLTSVMVTHNLEFAERCGRALRLRDGRLEEIAGGGCTGVGAEVASGASK